MTAPTRQPPPAPPERVLIVRPSALGDVSRTVPALATLRRAWPQARIDWLVAAPFADTVRHHPMLDAAVPFDRHTLAGFARSIRATRAGLALRRQLRDARYDTVYDLQGLLRSGIVTRLTAAPRRVGFADAREGGWLGYNVRHRIDATHTVDRMLGLLQADGHEPVRDMRLHVGDADRQWLAEFRAKTGIGDGPYACLAPTARWRCKCWPLQRYAEIAQRLLDSEIAGSHLVVLASPDERAQLTPFMEALPPAMRDRVHLPDTAVGQLMALLSETRLLVCNDSAALHIAVGFDRPIAAVFGPTDPARVGPYRRDDAIVQPPDITAAEMRHYRRQRNDQSLVARVTAEQVWAKIRQQCAARRDASGSARVESHEPQVNTDEHR